MFYEKRILFPDAPDVFILGVVSMGQSVVNKILPEKYMMPMDNRSAAVPGKSTGR
jgi:hypothetical protein